MSSSEDESAVQNIILRSKRSERTPIEIEVTELLAAKLIIKDSASIPALQTSLKHDLNAQNQLLTDAVESEKMMQNVVKIITKYQAGELTMDLSKEEHKSAQKLITNHVSENKSCLQQLITLHSENQSSSNSRRLGHQSC